MASKIVITAATVAAVLGAGGTALAVTGSDTTNGTPTSTTASHAGKHTGKNGKKGKDRFGLALKSLEHGEFVTKAKTGTVTHDVIRGSVTAVSSSSITVKAADGTTMTFTVGKTTHVRKRSDGKGAKSSITDVKTGDTALVAGTGTSTKTARIVVDGLK